jgi:hypothetical protein
MGNDINALRQHLFDTLAALKDKEKPMDIDRAKAISDVAQVIINSAKVEVEYAKATGATGSSFLGLDSVKPPQGALPSGITGITRHVLK